MHFTFACAPSTRLDGRAPAAHKGSAAGGVPQKAMGHGPAGPSVNTAPNWTGPPRSQSGRGARQPGAQPPVLAAGLERHSVGGKLDKPEGAAAKNLVATQAVPNCCTNYRAGAGPNAPDLEAGLACETGTADKGLPGRQQALGVCRKR